MTDSTWRKNGIADEPGGHWAISIARTGAVGLFAPLPPLLTGEPVRFTTMRAAVYGASIVFGATVDGACPSRGTYTWNVAGKRLALRVVKDGCSRRRVLLTAGTWART